MNKPVCLGLLMLEISKIVMREFWYDYANQNMEERLDFFAWIFLLI